MPHLKKSIRRILTNEGKWEEFKKARDAAVMRYPKKLRQANMENAMAEALRILGYHPEELGVLTVQGQRKALEAGIGGKVDGLPESVKYTKWKRPESISGAPRA